MRYRWANGPPLYYWKTFKNKISNDFFIIPIFLSILCTSDLVAQKVNIIINGFVFLLYILKGEGYLFWRYNFINMNNDHYYFCFSTRSSLWRVTYSEDKKVNIGIVGLIFLLFLFRVVFCCSSYGNTCPLSWLYLIVLILP